MKAWDEIWKSDKYRGRWLEPDPLVTSLLPKFKEEGIKTVLDLGFGIGRHAILFAKDGFDVYGIDSSPTGLEYATKWAEEEKIDLKLEVSEMNRLPFEDEQFDLIIAWNVLYHGTVDYIYKAISEVKRCLKPNGYLLCTIISTKNKRFGVGEEIEKGTFIIPEVKETSHPHHFFDMEEINQYLNGFTLLKCEDMEQPLVPHSESFHWHILAKLASNCK